MWIANSHKFHFHAQHVQKLITKVDFPLVQTRGKKKSTEKEVGVSKRKHTPITISQKIEVCIEKK